jgi:hypothetical protein
MNAVTQAAVGSYMANRGHVLINRAGLDLLNRFEALKTQVKALDAAFAGALLASVFTHRPWLQALHLTVGAEQQPYDGGSFRSIHLRVSQVKPLEGVPLPADLEIDGHFDDGAAAFELERSLRKDATDLYDALVANPDDCVDVEESISRQSITELLQVEEIDGRAAFARLCPERAAELGVA